MPNLRFFNVKLRGRWKGLGGDNARLLPYERITIEANEEGLIALRDTINVLLMNKTIGQSTCTQYDVMGGRMEITVKSVRVPEPYETERQKDRKLIEAKRRGK